MKAGVISIKNLIQTLRALKRIRTRVASEQALHPDHSTIGTIQSLKKWADLYALNGTPVHLVAPGDEASLNVYLPMSLHMHMLDIHNTIGKKFIECNCKKWKRLGHPYERMFCVFDNGKLTLEIKCLI